MKNLFTLILSSLLCSQITYAQWEKVTNPDANYLASAVMSHGGKLYAALNSGVFVSDDNGGSWTNTNSTTISSGMASKFLTSAGSNVYVAGVSAGGGDFVNPLKYDGQNWIADTVGIPQVETKCLFSDQNRIFIARTGNTAISLYTKLNTESSWTAVTSIPAPNSVFVMYKFNNTFYAVTGGYKKIWTSTDGLSFTESTQMVPEEAGGAFTTSNAVYLATYNGLFKSTDGMAFTRIDVDFAKHAILGTAINAVFADGDKVYASALWADSAYESTNGGTSWTSISGGDITNSISSFTKHNGAIFATQAAWGTDAAQVIKYGATSTSLAERSMDRIDINVYPNPATAIVHIDTKEAMNISLFNLSGVMQLNSSGNTIDVSGLSKGLYLLKITTEKGTATRKLIIE